MSAEACFCGAAYNLPARECAEGHSMDPDHAEAVSLRAECEHLRAVLVHIHLDIEEWKVEKQGAWTTIARIEKRVKDEIEKEPAQAGGVGDADR